MFRAVPSSRLALALLGVGAIAAGCGDVAGPGEPPAKIDELPRRLSLAEAEIIARSNDFGFDLLREVHARETDSPNVFLSPLSASMAVGMALNGTAGETFDSIRATLGFEGLGQEQINRSYRDLGALLLDLDPSVELGIANSVWARQGFPFVPEFFEAVRTWFDGEAREMDFTDPATLDAINGWAAERTNERIDEVLEVIRPGHVLFLLNAVYFKGAWTDRFDPAETREAPFTLADGAEVAVERMMGRPNIGVAAVDGVRIGELPYGGQAFVMDVVLPAPGEPLADLIARLDAGTWAHWMEAVGEYGVREVGLPKLELEYEKILNRALEALGMGPAFVPGRADFSRLTPVEVYIDFVKQNTFLRVDEEGTEAAAVATVAIIERASAAPETPFIVDRPYLLAIRERISGTILFIGAIGDPRAG